MKYINLSSSLLDSQTLVLHGESYHHVVRVLRYKEGDTFWVRLPREAEIFQTQIKKIERNQALLEVKVKKLVTPPSLLKIHLILPWLKKEALELALRQAVEVGVSAITLVKTDFSVAEKHGFSRKQQRYVKLIEQAGEQSGNPYLPSLKIKEGLKSVLCEIPKGEPFFYAHHETNDTQKNLTCVLRENFSRMCHLMIGPEGGISEKELAFLEHVARYKVFFPTYILRASSASLYLISMIQTIYKEVTYGE